MTISIKALFGIGQRVKVDDDLVVQITGIMWDGTSPIYRCAYWHDGNYKEVELYEFEIEGEEV